MHYAHASQVGVRLWRALPGTCGGAGWGATGPAVCRDMAELRLEPRFPVQFLSGNNEDLSLVPMGLRGFQLGDGP